MRPTKATKNAWLPVLGLLAALGALSPSEAEAQGGFYLGVGLGPAIRVDDWPTQFRIEQEIGYYFSGEPQGFFLAFAPSQSFGNNFWMLTFAPRLGYMFEVFRNRDVQFQLGPAGTIPGVAVAGCDYDADWCRADAWFHMSFSFMMRLLLARGRVAIYLRPVEFEFAFGGDRRRGWGDSGIRYVLQGGVQFHF
jgi:hypothetical protein